MSLRKICIVVLSRANYGSIKSMIKALSKDKNFKLQIITGGSALLSKYGNVDNVIAKDGFKINEKIFFVVEGETPSTMVKSTAVGMLDLSTAFERLKPDLVFAIGDRYETMATVLSASYMNIPIAHTMGGEISGTIDESIRHAITKFAHLHFPATKKSAKNIFKMGEDKKNIYHVGCPRIDTVKDSLNKKIDNLNNKIFDKYIHQINEEIKETTKNKNLLLFSDKLEKYVELLVNFTSWLEKKYNTSKDDVSSACNDYLKVFGYVSLGYSWLKILRISHEKLQTNKDFFEDKINTATYYFDKILPRAQSHYISAISGSETMMKTNFN